MNDHWQFNYDESKVPDYELPDPLRPASGEAITAPAQWPARREAIHELFAREVYGRWLPAPPALRFEEVERDEAALEGRAVRKQIVVHFTERDEGPRMELMLHLPREAAAPAPTFVGLNFFGNHAVHADPRIGLSSRWMRDKGVGVEANRATEAARGAHASRWPLARIVERGYGVATIYCGDLALDEASLYRDDVLSLFQDRDEPRAPADAGAIGAWAWGLSRAMDYFQGDAAVDHERVAVLGHSRLGKTALWAGANDERFALAISNNSGCGGAALSRRRFGETVARINRSFPHWFCERFKAYGEREDALPLDQHMLIALLAPRPVYVASAADDLWADPRGEFLAAKAAEPVYHLLGLDGLPAREMPAVGAHVHGTIGYHIRAGGHGLTEEDWLHYLDFADMHLQRAPRNEGAPQGATRS